MHRRDFLGRTAGSLGAIALARTALASAGPRVHAEVARRGPAATPARLADDEPFWAEVRRAFDLEPAVLNFDNGWTNPTPRAAVDELATGAARLEALPAERIMEFWEEVTDVSVRAGLAEVLGVPGEELAFVRNATEALDTVILGAPLERGDEIVCSTHDYYAMLDALEQRQARDGVVLRMVRPPVPAPSLAALAELYDEAIGPRARLVLLTHPSNLTGQFLPVRRIAEAAHRVGARVVVDGAQSLGLHATPVLDLGVDFYGASLHKWLGAPIGLGVLWMRPEHTSDVWPLVPSPRPTGMSRYEWIGTNPEYIGPAVLPALRLHESIGAARKAARLHYLAAHLRERLLASFPAARFYTLADEEMSCGLTTFELPGQDAAALQRRLRAEHGILVQAMEGRLAPEIAGLRVSPNVYHTPAEVDRFVAALATVARG